MLKSIALAAVLGSGMAVMPACMATGSAYIVEDDPPAPQEEVVVTRPGYIYVHGNWRHDRGRWEWNGGHYEQARTNQRYVEGRWQRRSNHQHVWVQGGWRTEGGVSVR